MHDELIARLRSCSYSDPNGCDACGDCPNRANYYECKQKLALQAADVRPVVLCRDCKHSEPWYADKSRCFLWHESGIDVFNDGFCNYGEKREES